MPRPAAFRLRLPHPLLLLVGGVAVAMVLTWLLPAGDFQRVTHAESGREVVVPGTWATATKAPVSLFSALLAIPRGMAAGADVLLTILFVGAAFVLLDQSGALGRLVQSVVQRARSPRLVVIGMTLAFATLGALDNSQEEIVALIPALLLLSRGVGAGPLTALAMSVGAASVGSAFGPTNPYQTGIALRFAELPPLSAPLLRTGAFVAALAVWCAFVLWGMHREARAMPMQAAACRGEASAVSAGATRRDLLLLAIALVPFVPYVVGVLRWEWGFHELSALFLVAGYSIGLASGRSLAETTEALIEGMKTMLPATLYVGVARAIGLVLEDGHVLDTIIHGLSLPVLGAPPALAPVLMIPAQALLHLVVPSVSGQATLTMPIMAPVADLVGSGRDAAVFAYQTGAGLSDTIVPTNGAVMAMLASTGVPFDRWLRFAGPGLLAVAAIGAAAVLLAA